MKKQMRQKKKLPKIVKIPLAILAALFIFIVIVGTNHDKEVAARSATPTATVEPTSTPTAQPTASPSPAPTATATPAPTEYPLLKKGSKGDTVKKMQERLIELGYLSGKADGDYGAMTVQAVKDFQVNNNLKEDGEAGNETLTVMFSQYPTREVTYFLSNSNIVHRTRNCSGMKSYTEVKLSEINRKGYKFHDHCN